MASCALKFDDKDGTSFLDLLDKTTPAAMAVTTRVKEMIMAVRFAALGLQFEMVEGMSSRGSWGVASISSLLEFVMVLILAG